jgi:sensor histidine kinase YesM
MLIILHKRSAENFFYKFVAANKGLLSSYSSKCFFGIMSKTVLVVVFVLLPQKTFKIFSKILGMLRLLTRFESINSN